MNISVKWIDGMLMVGKSDSGHAVVMDGPPEIGGENLGVRPMEMLLLGMTGCTVIDVISTLKKMREDVVDCQTQVNADRSEEYPKVFTNIHSAVVDPKNFDANSFVDIQSDVCVIPPNSFALARTVEYFKIPRKVLTICLGKSTYARCGIIVNVTPLEPEWEGHVTLEFSNTTNLPAKIYAGEGVAQMIFFESDEDCDVSYKDRGGKYQGQTGVTLPKT